MPQDANDLEAMRKSAGRINQGEYSKLTGTLSKPASQISQKQKSRKNLGRVSASEYAALSVKRVPRKAARRKRVAAK